MALDLTKRNELTRRLTSNEVDANFTAIEDAVNALFDPDATAPSSASDTGTKGEVRFDSSYIYVCTATDTWKRVAIATW